jgi:hypothetical protein
MRPKQQLRIRIFSVRLGQRLGINHNTTQYNYISTAMTAAEETGCTSDTGCFSVIRKLRLNIQALGIKHNTA